MKYIQFWDDSPERLSNSIKKIEKVNGLSRERSEKFPKILFGPYTMLSENQYKGFTIIEATPEQLEYDRAFFAPEGKMRNVPIIETEVINRIWKELKK